MKQKNDPSILPAKTLSRRAALHRVVVAGLAAGGLSALPNETGARTPAAEPDFIPENDYPYFGYEPAAE